MRPRSSSVKDENYSHSFMLADELRVETMISKTRSSSAASSEAKNIGQHLDQLEHTSKDSSVNFVIGRSDYNPSRGDEGMAKWEEFERQAAVGMSGALHENFMGSVQIMDQSSDNSQMPFTVVNGKIDNFIQPIHKFLFSIF